MKKAATLMAIAVASAGCSVPIDQPATPASTITAEFRVTTTGKATVMYGTTSGTSQTETSKNWSKKVLLKQFDGATLVVSNGDVLKSVKVTCEILIDGVSKSKNSASGKTAAASCSAAS